jgi:hypothetical protein
VIDTVTLALSIFLLAFGAMLMWGVEYEAAGLDLVGAVLLVAGTIGALLAAATYARNRPADRVVRRDYLEH